MVDYSISRYKHFTKKQIDTMCDALYRAMDLLDCVSQEEFARKIDVNPSTPGFWFRGQKSVSLKVAKRIEKLTKGKITIFDLVADLHKYS